jgi:hypothetical protein
MAASDEDATALGREWAGASSLRLVPRVPLGVYGLNER